MKSLVSRGVGTAGFVLAIGMGLGSASPAFSQEEAAAFIVDFRANTWKQLEGLGTDIDVRGINDSGQIAGRNGDSAFITGLDGVGMTNLGNLGGQFAVASDVNNAGQASAYWASLDVNQAFIIEPGGTEVRQLGTLGGRWNDAHAINSSGQIVGRASLPMTCLYCEPDHAFMTGPDGTGIRDLGTLGGNFAFAYGINDAGRAVGQSATTEGEFHAFITGADGTEMRDLGMLPGDNGAPAPGRSLADDINEAGQVAGWSDTADGNRHAFITGPDGGVMTDLGTLGGMDSSAGAINDEGRVAGWAEIADGSRRAFITGPDGAGMTDLNSLLDLPGGVILTEATDINNAGQVVAIGTVPEPETYAMLLAGLLLISVTARRRMQNGGPPARKIINLSERSDGNPALST